jgi:hypothetical protein
MEANEIKFEDIELTTWYSILYSEFGDFWMMITKKSKNEHESISFSKSEWIEHNGIVKRRDWHQGEFGTIGAIRKINEEGWDLISQKLFKSIFNPNVNILKEA